MSHPFRFFFSTVLLSFAFLVALPQTHAQTASPIFVPVALAPTQRDTAIALSALTLDADILERNGRTIISGNSAFKLHNTDRLNDVQVSVGFPSWAGDPYVFDPGKLDNFSVSIDDVKVKTLTPAKAELRIGNTIRTVDWYTFTLSIAGDEKKTVRYEFAQDLGDSAMPRFVYGILPATSWKGSIDSARLTLRLPETTSPEQIIASEPANPEFDGQSITWSWAQKDPASNPALIILRQSTWIDLNNKRRAAQQNPNDVNARVALGALLRQLASMDSPKRDGLSSQAIAELETAVRLDPNNRAARQTLGAVYEARAGAAAGPRNLGYVQLAVAQWQAIASSDANARKQLAEDYFYLGLDAQTRGAFADASNYFDQASALAPGGAGPLFTTDRLTAQRRALNIAWARTLLDTNDADGERQSARGARQIYGHGHTAGVLHRARGNHDVGTFARDGFPPRADFIVRRNPNNLKQFGRRVAANRHRCKNQRRWHEPGAERQPVIQRIERIDSTTCGVDQVLAEFIRMGVDARDSIAE